METVEISTLGSRNMVKKAFILIVSMIFSACTVVKNYEEPLGPRYEGKFAPPPPVFGGSIKIVSYNIKFGKKISQAAAELSSIPELENADILLLQEMDPQGVETLAHKLQFNYIYYPGSLHFKYNMDYGDAVLSKWPIKSSRKVILPYEHPFRKQIRLAVFAVIQVGRSEILASSVHTEVAWLPYTKRMDQFETIVKNIPGDSKYVVVGGDLNTLDVESVKSVEKIFGEAGLSRVSKGVGSTAKADPTRVLGPEFDQIYARGMTLMKNGKPKNTKASDHFPIWVQLKLAGGG
jgi:endonuclease/exonuclease/phosphatase family metal-dependent hydrolase